MVEEQEKEESVPTQDSEESRAVSSDLIRGHINTIILRALYEGDKYGYEIITDIENKTHGQYSLKQPSLYSALKRLEKEGCITSFWGGSVAGGRRKYFSLTELGKEISERNQSEWEYSRTIIDSLISDKDFDFNNPAPNSVDMRILRDNTSRVPRESGEEVLTGEYQQISERETALQARSLELKTREDELSRERERLDALYAAKKEELQREQAWRESELAMREQNLERTRAQLETRAHEITLGNRELDARAAAEVIAQRDEDALKQEIAEIEKQLREARMQADEYQLQYSRAIKELESTKEMFDESTQNYEKAFGEALEAERQRIASEESFRTTKAIEDERVRLAQEFEIILKNREEELRRQNYLDLIQSPPAPASADREYKHYTAPAPAPAPAPTATVTVESSESDYRSVVGKLYENSVRPTDTARETSTEASATPLDGIDFREIERRAAQDGIRISTAGGKTNAVKKEEPTESTVNKGKALFLSSVVACVFCVILGSILLGVQKTASIPIFLPYFVWCAGVALMLVMGLAFANHYGIRAIRRPSGIVLVNSGVIYALCVIVTLIVALSVRIDFKAASALISWVVVPIVFSLIVPLFGTIYYLLIRPKKK